MTTPQLNRYHPRMSQHGQDTDFLDYYRAKHGRMPRDLRVVEIGAHDGVELSNSHDLCRDGLVSACLLVEPNRRSFAALQKNRPEATCRQLAVVGEDLPVVHFLGVMPADLHTAPEPLVGDGSLLGRVVEPGTRGSSNSAAPADTEPYPVAAIRLAPLLEDFGGPIDFISIDIEGAELPVIERYFRDRRPSTPCPWFWCVEVDDGGPATREVELDQLMVKNGLKYVGRSPRDLYYVASS